MIAGRKFFALVGWAFSLIALAVFIQQMPAGLVGLAAPPASPTGAAGLVQPVNAPANLLPNPDRNSYGIGIFIDANRNPVRKPVKEAFVNLPAMPADFGEMIHLMRTGNFNQIALGLGAAYFKQPEFLPRFEEIGLPYWTRHDLRRWGREGFGVYPAEQQYSLKAGQEISIAAFVHSAYGIETFQGMQLYPFFPQDENAALFFSISIEPLNILLGPTYPIVDANWMHRVVIKIKARNEAPKGSYLIGFNPTLPDAALSNEWSERYGYKFVAGQGMFSIDKPRLAIWVKVG